MERAKLSLKWLEVFQVVAKTGSVQETARRLGLSISTVSHHLSCLEQAIGVDLIDHARRPMRLTMAGETMLRRVDEALLVLRKGMTEVWSSDLRSVVRRLTVASIEDLDPEVIPFLASHLAQALPACELAFLSRPSHETIALLQAEDVDMGIATTGEFGQSGLIELPLLRDPYVLVVPRIRSETAEAYLNGQTGLTFLRYSKKQLIGRRIEAQLRRLRMDIPQQLEFESTQPILSLIAEGHAWTITTALNFACGFRHHDRIQAMALPGGGFARRLSLFSRADLPGGLIAQVDARLRTLIESRILAPALVAAAWLDGDFRILSKSG